MKLWNNLAVLLFFIILQADALRVQRVQSGLGAGPSLPPSMPGQGSAIFKGISIFVNGLTDPPHQVRPTWTNTLHQT